MKKILGIIALGALSAAVFTSCGNKPPFEKLIASVDSANAVLRANPLPLTDSCGIKYNKITNTVEYWYNSRDSIEPTRIDSVAEDMQTQFMLSVITNYPSITQNILDANANILMQMNGSHDTKYELEIENSEFVKFYDDLYGKK